MAGEVISDPSETFAAYESPCKSVISLCIRIARLAAHQPKRFRSHDVRRANERFIEVEIAARHRLLLMTDQSGDAAIREAKVRC